MQENVDFEWVPVKSGDGSVVTDGKGNPVLSRRFFTKSEKRQRENTSTPAVTIPKKSPVTTNYSDDAKSVRTKGPYGRAPTIYSDDAKAERTKGPYTGSTIYNDDAKAYRTKGPYSTTVYMDDSKALRTNPPRPPLVADVAALIQQAPSQTNRPNISAFMSPNIVTPATSSFLNKGFMVPDTSFNSPSNDPMDNLRAFLSKYAGN